MVEFLQGLTAEQQAALVGLVVAAIVYLVRHLKPSWFAGEGVEEKFQRTLSVVLLAGLGVFVKSLSTGSWTGMGAFLLAWAVAYASAEGAHTLVSRTSALRGDES